MNLIQPKKPFLTRVTSEKKARRTTSLLRQMLRFLELKDTDEYLAPIEPNYNLREAIRAAQYF